MKNNKSLSIAAITAAGAFLLSGIIIIILNGFWIHLVDSLFKVNSKMVQENYIKTNKLWIQNDVDRIIYAIKSIRTVELHNSNTVIYSNTNDAISFCQKVYNDYKQRFKKDDIVHILHNLFDHSSFYKGKGFYIVLRKNNNDNMLKNTLNSYSISKLKILFSDKYEGFVRLKSTNKRDIVGYAKIFQPLHLYVVSCLFSDDIEETAKNNAAMFIAEENAHLNRNSYIFVNDIRGNVIVLHEKIFNNKTNMWNVYDNISKKKIVKNVFQKELAIHRNKGYGYIEYKWIEPKTQNIASKISFIKEYRRWGWMVGEGFYKNEILNSINKLKKQLKSSKVRTVNQSHLFVLLITLVSFVFVYLVFKVFEIRFKNLFQEFEHALLNNSRLEPGICLISELNRFIGYINNAVERFNEYEDEFLEAFIYSMETRDVYTKGHSQRVALISKIIAKELGFDENKQDEIYKAGLLHDIGKIGIPDNILLKPGKLTQNEYQIVKYHALFSYEIVSKIAQFRTMAKYIRQHHERCDGSGYPDGLTCKDIAIEARILSIADVYDALTSKRAYRDKMSPQEAINIIKQEPLDQDIVSKVEQVLIENSLEEFSVELTVENIEKIEQIRQEMFNVDYATGLKRRKVLTKRAGQLADAGKEFCLVLIDIKGLSFINYAFSIDAGDKLIENTSLALSNILRSHNFANIEYLSRILNDSFMFIVEDKELIENIFSTLSDIKEKLINDVKNLFNEIDKNICINYRGEHINSFIDYHTAYSVYPYDTKDIDRLIYLCVIQKNKTSANKTQIT